MAGNRLVITLIEYDAAHYSERQIERVEELAACLNGPGKCWINIDGLEDAAMLQRLGDLFGLHPLAIEDVLQTVQRPKVEEYEDHFYIVAQMVYAEAPLRVEFEQVSIFFSGRFLITIQEAPGRDVFEPVRARLRNGHAFSRSRGYDDLAYQLVDAIVDQFFPVLERLGEAVEDLEIALLKRPSKKELHQLHALKRILLKMRRNAWPMREMVNALIRDESGMVTSETKVFLRDCYDHTIQILDMIETYRDILGGMMDLYLSSLSMRTNEIMRVLTVVSTIFIPLTFIVGVYGMNFDYMPELRTRYGYFICLGVMGVLAVGMLILFRRNKWL